jgi:hypothetical protein
MKIVKGKEKEKGVRLLNALRGLLEETKLLGAKYQIGKDIKSLKRNLVALGMATDGEVTPWFNCAPFVVEIMETPDKYPDAYDYLKRNGLLELPRIGVAGL